MGDARDEAYGAGGVLADGRSAPYAAPAPEKRPAPQDKAETC